MTIKQQGGVFGRNPTFNNVEVDGTATLDSIASGTKLEIKGSDNPAAYIEFENTFQNAGIATQAGLLLGVNSSVQTNYAGVIATEDATNSNGVLLGLYANNGSGPLLVAQARSNKNFEIVDGDLVVASGHGIDFSATAGTGTSELFDDYEEGTWTPIDASGAGLSFVSPTGVYTKIGRTVMATGFVQYPVTGSGANTNIGGLPFTNINSTSRGLGVINYRTVAAADTILPTNNATTFIIATSTGGVVTNAQLSNTVVYFGLFYTTS